MFRLDNGHGQFSRRWGYETLEIIQENVIQHSIEKDLETEGETEGKCQLKLSHCITNPTI